MGLCDDAENGNLSAVRERVEQNGEDVDTKRDGETALFCAAGAGEVEVVRYLLSKGADVNALNDDGDSPLNRAASFGYARVVDTLVATRKCHVAHKDSEGYYALHNAVQSGSEDTVQAVLAAHGVSTEAAEDSMGYTALHEAALADSPALAKVLMARGASMAARDRKGNTPMHVACSKRCARFVKALLEDGGDVEAWLAEQNHNRQKVSDVAEASGMADTIKQILQLRAERSEEKAAAAAEEAAARRAIDAMKGKRGSVTIIDPTRRNASGRSVCWACGDMIWDAHNMYACSKCGTDVPFHSGCSPFMRTKSALQEDGEEGNSRSEQMAAAFTKLLKDKVESGPFTCNSCCVAEARLRSGLSGDEPYAWEAVAEPMEGEEEPTWPRRVPFADVAACREEAVRWGRIPVFLDSKGDADVDAFFRYQKVFLVEARQLHYQTQVAKDMTMEEAREKLRKLVVSAMKFGGILWLRMGNTAVNFTDNLCAPGTFPETIFHPSRWSDPAEFMSVVRPADTADTSGIFLVRKGFSVMVTSSFSLDEVDGHLNAALPNFGEMAIYDVIPETISQMDSSTATGTTGSESASTGGDGCATCGPSHAACVSTTKATRSYNDASTPGFESNEDALPFNKELLTQEKLCGQKNSQPGLFQRNY